MAASAPCALAPPTITWRETLLAPAPRGNADACAPLLKWIAWQGTEQGVAQVTIGHATKDAALQALIGKSQESSRRPVWFDSAERMLLAYCAGEAVDLNRIPIQCPPLTAFAQRVVSALRTVGYGQTVSYGELARRAGSSGAARAVGSVMSHNNLPLLIPCHRVLGAGGRLGGYSAPQGVKLKRELLRLEGVPGL